MELKYYKFVDSNNKIQMTQNISSDRSPGGVGIGDSMGNPITGEWVEMTKDEHDAHIEEQIKWAHDNPPPVVEPKELTAEEKLKNAGLTVDELKGLLGL
tara:strand:- start:47 stop:343 length:297 start_codon:yes stop_codon:yes gene_type:complete